MSELATALADYNDATSPLRPARVAARLAARVSAAWWIAAAIGAMLIEDWRVEE